MAIDSELLQGEVRGESSDAELDVEMFLLKLLRALVDEQKESLRT